MDTATLKTPEQFKKLSDLFTMVSILPTSKEGIRKYPIYTYLHYPLDTDRTPRYYIVPGLFVEITPTLKAYIEEVKTSDLIFFEVAEWHNGAMIVDLMFHIERYPLLVLPSEEFLTVIDFQKEL